MEQNNKNISRRKAIKYLGLGVIAAAGGYTLAKSSLFGDKIKKEVEDGTLKMATRTDKATGKEVSLLGYGCMRFPTYDTGEKDQRGRAIKAIDMEQSQILIDYAYANGINYYDTAYNYHGGKSGEAIGKFLSKYPRESYFLANKMPTWLIDSPDKPKQLFEEQLTKCGVEYFDYYLLHALSSQEAYDKAYEENKGYEYLLKEKEAGRIKRLGFSFHGDEAFFDYLLNKHEWDFVLLQINYIDWKEQNAEYFYNELEKRGIPCMIMEPLKGGSLANLTPDANEILKSVNPDDSIASWAFRYAGSLPSVLTVLSGMTKMEHLKDNLSTFKNFKPLSEQEREALDKAIEEFNRFKQIGCTDCKYCMPCRFGVDIPAIFAAYNKCVKESNIPDLSAPRDSKFDKKKKAFLATYKNMVPEGARADKCIDCGRCKPMCPQKLDIPKLITDIKKLVKELED
jgi:predicted aldo/keto reductase-like oxidoreductase